MQMAFARLVEDVGAVHFEDVPMSAIAWHDSAAVDVVGIDVERLPYELDRVDQDDLLENGCRMLADERSPTASAAVVVAGGDVVEASEKAEYGNITEN